MRELHPREVVLWACLAVAAGCSRPLLAADTPQPDRPNPIPGQVEPAASQHALGLADLEQMAVEGNPTLRQTAANVEAARGRAAQSGLYPNPTVGYEAERIGAAGTPGELQGAFIDQTIVTAGKRRLNRARYAQEVSQAEAQALAQQYRVLNGVRLRFYQLLAMQRLIDVQADLLKVAEDAVTTTEELVNVGAANKPDLLQARIEARQERVALANARSLYESAWQQTAAFVGNPCLAVGRVQGDLEAPGPVPGYDAALAHLLEASPEIQVARAEVARSQFALRREQVEPIPNVQVRVANGYDFETRKDTTSVTAGVRVPLFDKNQGNIRAAQAQVAYAREELKRVELSLRQRLAQVYGRYRTSEALVQLYREQNLPDARQAYELYLDSFRKRRAAWPQVLVAQRTYFQISVDYTQALNDLRRAEVAILGLLLVDGLDEPPGVPSQGPVRSREQQSPQGNLPDPIGPRGGRSLENATGPAGPG
jgi:cobalt-zinc-cadmium efflux system outer membrane protein